MLDKEIIKAVIFLALSALYRHFPPKSTNWFYGYRTPTAMKSVQNWKLANAYCSQSLLIGALLSLIAVVVAKYVFKVDSPYVFIVGVILTILVSIVLVEMKLTNG